MAAGLINLWRTTAPGGEKERAGNVIGGRRAGGGKQRSGRLVIG